ncbi:endonuclease domain-containing protein [Streptomyces malaysiensis]|uniref:endonuclease domain-containing protein n=1 Tax=Streptomyces malaysiensis TaxID=92644 RepID=UPI0024C06F5C|nr:endonuclease domain-containing protein [Streptomyces sp. NA07423]MCC4319597.1 endonuclease VII domain-containing protein [Streptomyces malaysiensis]WHX18828.1 endonuclease domain-containing protein [Streptomyces sp. NA07423]
MSERAMPGRTDGLITLGAADALWVDLTAGSAVPTASGAFTRSPAHPRMGYVLLGGHVVATVRASGGQWRVPEAEVRRAAAELNAVGMDRRDLVRIGPFRAAPGQENNEDTPLRWRRRITGELREPGGPERAARREVGPPYHLAGIDWRRLLVARTRDGTQRTWWLPRAVVRLLDAAEHTEAQWVQAARTRRSSAAVTEPPSHPRQARDAEGRRTTSPEGPTAPPRPYNGELEGRLYSVLSRKPGSAGRVAGWACAVCRTAPAAVLDHCHEHGYVRAPVCQSCNTQERPDHLYSNDIRVANRYTRLFHTDADDWLRHWHRCPGCRARTTLPLPHLAAWTAHIACRSLRPTHPAPRGRKPCGVLRVSWTGSQNAPRSCLLTVAVDFCPSGEHRVLARVPYREAAERFVVWLAETAPAVAAAAGPDRLDGLPAQSRPVIADTSGEGLALF